MGVVKATAKKLVQEIKRSIKAKITPGATLASPKHSPYTYEPVFPNANYAPWRVDEAFQKVYKQAKNYSLVDEYRLYGLWELVANTNKLEGNLLEVGSWRGGSAAVIATQAMHTAGILYVCDTFSGVVKAGEHDSFYKGGEHKDTGKHIADQLLKHTLQLENVEILQGIFPDETAQHIPKGMFRFCHIDVDVYDSAKDVVDWLWPRLVPNGIIAFDDYSFPGQSGITRYVEEMRDWEDTLVIHNLNGHAIIIKIS